MTRTRWFYLGLGVCASWACGTEFRSADPNAASGGKSHAADGGEGDGATSMMGESGEGTIPGSGGGEGGAGVEPGGRAGEGVGGSVGPGGSGGSSQAGSAGSAGTGGTGVDPGSCAVADNALVLEKFATDVFGTPSWTRSSPTSVQIDGQQLLITQDNALDDYADYLLADGQLPLVVQVRAAMMTQGHAHRWPVIDLFPAVGDVRLTITFQNGTNAGWQFTKQDDFTASFLNAPEAAEFMTVRAFIGPGGGVLCTKTDAQPDFVKVATTTWDFSAVKKLRLRQAYDEICRFDDLTLYR